jgi:hypothetical protein
LTSENGFCWRVFRAPITGNHSLISAPHIPPFSVTNRVHIHPHSQKMCLCRASHVAAESLFPDLNGLPFRPASIICVRLLQRREHEQACMKRGVGPQATIYVAYERNSLPRLLSLPCFSVIRRISVRQRAVFPLLPSSPMYHTAPTPHWLTYEREEESFFTFTNSNSQDFFVMCN